MWKPVKFVGFEYEGVWITNPTVDETGRFEVDPEEYYGKERVESGYRAL